MKLYYFNPNGYGHEYFVMANTKLNAYLHLMMYLREKMLDTCRFDNDEYNFNHYESEYNEWNKVKFTEGDIVEPKYLPFDYTIDEYGGGEVIESEIA